ncbi:MAG: DUF2089 domain-containing protein [Tenericutes bacterium]|nr:DUF2089 domain-containing protein [Mycoplasmatota bacterium]
MAKFKIDKDLDILKRLTKSATKGVAKYPVISECPICHNDLFVTELKCTNCETEFKGKFTLSKFNYLDTEKLFFIEVFVKNRGNIKMIEKEMGLSYPTIKKMLDEVIEQLGYTTNAEEEKEVVKEEYNGPTRVEILQKIDSGEITVSEASELLAKVR